MRIDFIDVNFEGYRNDFVKVYYFMIGVLVILVLNSCYILRSCTVSIR